MLRGVCCVAPAVMATCWTSLMTVSCSEKAEAEPVGQRSVSSMTPPLPSVGVSIVMESGRRQNGSLADD